MTPSTPNDRAFFGHPRGLSTLFFTEMWERFSYYGMRALLVLYMVGSTQQPGLNFSTGKATQIYGLYTMLVYLSGIPGGYIADRFIGTHRSMLVGGILIALGHVVLALSGIGPLEFSATGMSVFVMGLALIILGTGHFKPTVSVMVGQL
jgi:POT family proton-dependent oligopeptide transporter